jgi:hypothetical protein
VSAAESVSSYASTNPWQPVTTVSTGSLKTVFRRDLQIVADHLSFDDEAAPIGVSKTEQSAPANSSTALLAQKHIIPVVIDDDDAARQQPGIEKFQAVQSRLVQIDIDVHEANFLLSTSGIDPNSPLDYEIEPIRAFFKSSMVEENQFFSNYFFSLVCRA